MSGLLKNGDERLGRVSATAVPRLQSAEEVERDRLKREIHRLHRDLGLRDAELARLEDEAEQAFKAGEAQGRAAGLAEAENDAGTRLARLESGIAAATERYEVALCGLETLSADLAWLAVHKVLGPTSERADVVRDIVRHQLQTLGARAVLWVEVSSRDFAADELADLIQSVGVADIQLRRSDELAGGDCRIKLVLGGLDVGLGQQMGQLRSALYNLVREDAPA